ncbi:general transcription factor 3C polypeptide 3 [Lingula anatina]|uniref:General transcription factor 3C polypeptide 3 n=1 Tax=Lingula anatina TaxID=7574 RepID=A0A1S3KGX3_LINAN|nr:general transcription factor 3C polypeptide 3 [Lingula anatina]|eukprot:XP_013421709.1 general transcription factor 3C polypeptide 3 [Lingula anatina]
MAQSNPGPMELFLAQANQEMTASPMDSENDDEDDEMDITFDDLLSPGQHPSSDLITKYLKGEMTFLQLQDAVRSKRRKEENVVSLETADQPLDIEKLTKMVQDMEQSQSGDSDAEPSAETSTTVGELPATPRKRRRRAKRTKLPKELQGLMGEANLKFARGETQEAIAMCNECIRQVPTAYEPYQTLGMLYEEMGDTEKSLQLSLIAAHLNPNDPEEWIKLAEMSLELNNEQQALHCYTKAVKYDKTNKDVMVDRCKLLEKMGDIKHALEGYHQIMNILPKENGEEYVQLAREVTKNYHEMGDVKSALETMSKTFQLHPSFITSEDVNVMVELHMAQKNYEQAFQVLIDNCGLKLELNIPDYEEPVNMHNVILKGLHPVSCRVPDVLPIDLRVKVGVLLIQLGFYTPVESVLRPLFEETPNDYGDLYLDVAEAYMDKTDNRLAKSILNKLVHSEKYNLPAVWLRYAECLSALGELQMAADAYKHVVEQAPSHYSARVSLSNIQQQLGKPEEALKALSQDDESFTEEEEDLLPQDVRLLLHKSMLLCSQGKMEECLKITKRLLFAYKLTPAIKKAMMHAQAQKGKFEAIKTTLGVEIENKIKTVPALQSGSGVTAEDLWDLYNKVYEGLAEKEMYPEMEDLSCMTLTCPALCNNINDTEKERYQELEWKCLIACVLNKNGELAYAFIKEIVLRDMSNTPAWNLFCQVISLTTDIRHNRFLLRMMMKYPENKALGMLNGHNSSVFGTYKSALGEYISVYRQEPDNALLNLVIGMTLINIASQKFTAKRHATVVQGVSFLNRYKELRGECQEVYYNLGRAMQQLGLFHASIFYYQKALDLDPAISGEDQELFDLRRETAYNLSLIYKSSGSPQMAQLLLQKYCVI